MGVEYTSLGIGALVVLPLLDRYCGISDGAFLVLGVLARITRLTVLAFSHTTSMIFSAAAISLPVVFIVSAAKSAVSKIVAEDEVGRMFSLVTCCETALAALGPMFLTLVYERGFQQGAWIVWAVDAGLWLLILPWAVYIYTTGNRKTDCLLDQHEESMR